MVRSSILLSSFFCLLGCQALTPALLAPAEPRISPSGQGTIQVSVLWPRRTVQMIPLSTNTLRLRVLKNGVSVAPPVLLSRPTSEGGVTVGNGSVQLNADSGLTVTVEAFSEISPASTSVSIASASATAVTVIANQRTAIALNLAPSFRPTVTDFSPKNGGPGVSVTVTGSFGDSGYYGISLSGVYGGASTGGAGSMSVSVPADASTSPLIAFADGASSSVGATFSVLVSLNVQPTTPVTTVNGTLQFSAPSAIDTLGLAVANPTITRWAVVKPQSSKASTIGTISEGGLFTATATGEAWVRAFSGNLIATRSLSVN